MPEEVETEEATCSHGFGKPHTDNFQTGDCLTSKLDFRYNKIDHFLMSARCYYTNFAIGASLLLESNRLSNLRGDRRFRRARIENHRDCHLLFGSGASPGG